MPDENSSSSRAFMARTRILRRLTSSQRSILALEQVAP
jgi:hypothetical protein